MRSLNDLLIVLQNFYALRKVGQLSQQVKYDKDTITFANVEQLIKKHPKMAGFYVDIYKVLQTMTQVQRDVVLRTIFEESDISKITDNKLELLAGKMSLVEKKEELLEKYSDFFNEMGRKMSSTGIHNLIKKIADSKITEEDIIKMNQPEIIDVIAKSNNYGSIKGLLTMSDENRSYYIKEYHYSLGCMMEEDYSYLGKMNFSNFQGFIQIVKEPYFSFKGGSRYRYTRDSFRFMNAIAKEYGNNKNVNFIFSNFKECLSILENGTLPDSFKRLIDTLTKDKSKKELKRIGERYSQFLSVNAEMRFLRYQTILDENFINNPNKNVIMSALEKQKYNTAKYRRKSKILLEKVYPPHQQFGNEISPFFDEEDSLSELERKGELINHSILHDLSADERRSCYKFVMNTQKKELMESRLQLMIVPNFLNSPYRPMILNRMKNVVTKQDADRLMHSTKLICSTSTTEEEKEAYMASLPGEEYTFEQDGLSISIYNLDSELEHADKEEIEIYQNSLKLIIRRNNTCKKQ